MTTRQLLRLLFGGALVLSTSPLAAQQPPPQRIVESDVTEMIPAYASLKDRIATADAVIRGRVVGDGRAVVPEGLSPGASTTVSTEFQLQILEVYKAHDGAESVGATVPVMQSGGEAIVGDVLMRTSAGRHLLVNGGEFLVFLKFIPSQNRFWTMTSDTFPIVDGRIKVDLAHATRFAFELDGVLSSDSQDALWKAVRAAEAEPAGPGVPFAPPSAPPPPPQ